MKELIRYTGESTSFTTLDFRHKGDFISCMQSYRFSFEIEDYELYGKKCFRVIVYHKETTFLFCVYCDEIIISDYICDDLGETTSKKERTLKVD